MTLPRLIRLVRPYNWLFSMNSYPYGGKRVVYKESMQTTAWEKRKCFVVILLLLSGDVHPNPGPDCNCLSTPDDLKARSGLGIIHINVRSLLPKIDHIKIWAKPSDSDVLVLSET